MVVGDALNTTAAEFLGELGDGGSLVEWVLKLCGDVLYHPGDLCAA